MGFLSKLGGLMRGSAALSGVRAFHRLGAVVMLLIMALTPGGALTKHPTQQRARAPVYLPGMHSYWNVECRDKDGNLKWAENDIPNLLHDEGEKALLSAYFDTDSSGFGAPPGTFYAGLRTNSSAEGDSLASGLTEVSGTGYARQTLSSTTGFTLSQVSGDWRATSNNFVFTATGTWTGAVALFMGTTNDSSGKLILSAALSTTRTLVNGDTLTCSFYVVMSE